MKNINKKYFNICKRLLYFYIFILFNVIFEYIYFNDDV